ncbi:GNAT family N-acetyltransferase [Puniceibacterium confluentis]|uniref:GNAT family N-acetyltransferase n=1 Tax=Puniceibacterium confluentis TaxID=1958944 RepID=UPI0011B649DB|nr:GNAT family N-acyltransferase [Puniceibacterium confluentis]
MITLCRGRYQSRIAAAPEDVAAAQALRHLAFHGVAGSDCDSFDSLCGHMLVEEVRSGQLVCCFRFMPLRSGSEIGRSYAAQFYELSALAGFSGPMIEMGRFCIRPGLTDPDILRIAWGAMTAYVDHTGAELLFGCASFPGTDSQEYLDAFATLNARHLAPPRWQPRVKAPEVFRFAQGPLCTPDPRKAMLRMPPLLRTYLMMGGWVSDHAVVDMQMNTLHVFTGVEIAAIPPARKRLLRAVAG